MSARTTKKWWQLQQERQVIAENDETYRVSVRSAMKAKMEGRITASMFNTVQSWCFRAALRRYEHGKAIKP